MGRIAETLFPVLMILGGIGQLFAILIGVLGFKTLMRIGMFIAMKLIPKNFGYQAMVEIPFSMTATAYVNEARTAMEPGYLSVGIIDWKITTAIEGLEDAIAAVYMEEHNGLGEVMRVVMKPGPLNYGSIMSWLVCVMSLAMMFFGLYIKLTAFPPEPGSDNNSTAEKEDDDDDD